MIKVYDSFRDKEICIMGLGYVGLTLATVMAEAGYIVTGVEINETVLNKLIKKTPHFYEPGLEERLRLVVEKGYLHFYKHIPKGYNGNIFIITVGTPLDHQGKVRLDMIKNVTEEISLFLKEDDLVIVRSTVKVGTTEGVIAPLLNKVTVKYDLAFCPERTLEGKALEELSWLPQLIGASSIEAGVRASQIFQFITPTVIRVSDIRTAETIKLIDNAHRDVIFAYSNEVASICDTLGISAAEVINYGKLGYPRTNLPLPGPVGGPCLSKDSHILIQGLLELGKEPEITAAARRINESQPEEVALFLKSISEKIENFPKYPVIALLGIAFKGIPATDDLRGTMAKPVFEALKVHFSSADFRGYDAVVPPIGIKKFGLEPFSDLESIVKDANIVIILNNHPVFSNLPIQKFSSEMGKPGIIYDLWNHYSTQEISLADNVSYVAIGSHSKIIFS